MNFDQYRRRLLDPVQGYKPLDFGSGGLNASIGKLGRLLAVNNYHQEHGYITLTSAPPFPEHERYNPAAVRAYRKSLIDPSSYLDNFAPPGWGLAFKTTISRLSHPGYEIVKQEFFLIEDVVPSIRLTIVDLFSDEGFTVDIVAFVAQGEIPYVVHLYHIDLPQTSAGRRIASYLSWSGILSLQRCAYTQLTEGGVIPIPAVQSELREAHDYLVLNNRALRARAEIYGYFHRPIPQQDPNLIRRDHGDDIFETIVEDGRLIYISESWGGIPSGTQIYTVDVRGYPIGHQKIQKNISSEQANQLLNEVVSKWQTRWQGVPDDLILRRALNYGLACCVPISEEATCIITDHMLLPLSWNRDAYYVARMLLSWQPDMAKHIRAHLIWMWEVTERVNGMWGRSYLANGKVKDRGYQLDQQLFPILELAEYVSETGDRTLLDRLLPQVHTLLDHLMQHKADFAPLFPTDETPADDPLTLPYHFSSHVLFWHALRKLTQVFTSQPPPYPPPLAGEDGGGQLQGWGSLADQIKAAVQQYFVAEKDGKAIYSYATDGRGSHRFYHDANDFPSVLAPIWGFCKVDDPIWRGTMEFAFSEANEGGYYAGRLGSVHTQAPWALGDVQDLILAKLLNDPAREQQARHQLEFAAQWDGALPEAYDADTGAVVSRHWFAWTNAAYACVELGAFKA